MKYIKTNDRNRIIENANRFTRFSLFIVFFWFGFLKIIGTSPAEGLVHRLFDLTLSSAMSIEVFLPLFGLLECLIGLTWLFPKYTKIAFWAMLVHMFCTFVPLVLLQTETWQSFLTLTLTGQYIIKNFVLLASSWYLYAMHSLEAEGEKEGTTAVERELVHMNA